MTEQTIRMTAKELAGAYYEDDHSERFRKLWPNVRTFIGRNWPTFVPMAREILVAQLGDKNTPIPMKDAIFKALQEDNSRQLRSKGSKVGRGLLNLNPEHPGTMERKLFHE